MTDRQTRWGKILDQLGAGSSLDPLILNEAMISQWLKDHRAEYTSATDTVKACLEHFGLHRRHRQLVLNVYCKTDFSHLRLRGG